MAEYCSSCCSISYVAAVGIEVVCRVVVRFVARTFHPCRWAGILEVLHRTRIVQTLLKEKYEILKYNCSSVLPPSIKVKPTALWIPFIL